MKIAVVSPGRSHLLDMSIMHIKNGHDVTFYTMVSKKRCKQFGFPAERVVSFFYICAPLMFIFRKFKLPKDGNRHLYYWIVRLVDFLSSLYLRKCEKKQKIDIMHCFFATVDVGTFCRKITF